MLNQARQGDLLFVRINKFLPEEIRGSSNNRRISQVLAYGESTGHAHVVEDGEVFTNEYDERLIVSSGKAIVKHPEHATVELPEGVYRVIRQRQFGEGGWANVGD